VSNFLNWLRNNPITVAAVVVALIAVGIFGYTYTLNNALRERMDEGSRPISSLDSLRQQSIMFPNPDPTQSEIRVSPVTINPPIIERFEQIYGEFDNQFRELYQFAVDRNQVGKEVMLEGLFPSPRSANLPFEARNAYSQRLRSFLDAPSGNSESNRLAGLSSPALNAGLPPEPARIDSEVADAEESTYNAIVSSRLEARESGLTESETADILAAKRQRYVDVLQDAASQIDLYAETDPRGGGFPFDIMPWAAASGSPAVNDMWEGQMQLWVLEDVVTAIATANSQAAEASPRTGVPASVVKRLLRLSVEPGYVGLSSAGIAEGGSQPENPDRLIPSPAQAQLENFVVSPTGRATNGVYLVRHAVLNAHVAFNKLPLLIDAIDATNFMTVIDVELENVDTYDALQERYFYGNDDVVSARIRIETLWFRDWLAPLMPRDIRRQLAQPDPDNDRRGGRRG